MMQNIEPRKRTRSVSVGKVVSSTDGTVYDFSFELGRKSYAYPSYKFINLRTLSNLFFLGIHFSELILASPSI